MHAAVASPPTLSPAQAEWVRQLEVTFAQIARTRMAGLPVVHPRLRVQAVGFHARSVRVGGAADEPRAIEAGALGVLVTPWFMNLVWLPLLRQDAPRHPGRKQTRQVGSAAFEFISAWDDSLGAYEACSLFSPMFAFVDHAAAQATAQEVLRALRQASTPRAGLANTPRPGRVPAPMPARRAFFLGRRASP